jgi:hypothetical protein
MSSHEVPPSVESSKGEWSDENSGSDGASDRLLTMMMEAIQTVKVVNHLTSFSDTSHPPKLCERHF